MYLPEANWLPASSLSPRRLLPLQLPRHRAPGRDRVRVLLAVATRSHLAPEPLPGGAPDGFLCPTYACWPWPSSTAELVLCSTSEMGLRPVDDIVPEKWVGVVDAACLALGRKQQLLLVGSREGTVELFDLTKSSMHLRAVSSFRLGVSHSSLTPSGPQLAVIQPSCNPVRVFRGT